MKTVETLLAEPLVIALGWALIHFIWQGTLVALLLAGLLKVSPRGASRARYAAACIAMLLMPMLPLTTVAIKLSTAGNLTDGSPSLITAHSVSKLITAGIETPVATTQPDIPRVPPQPWPSVRAASIFSLLPWTILLWLLGVVFFSLRLICGWLYTERLRTRGVRLLEERWQQALERLCFQLRVTRPIRLLESTLVGVPTTIGWLRPIILLPVSSLAGLSPQQLEAIIAHELAHIGRHDYLINLLQALIETLLFYHPAVWWVSGQIRQEREYCCDDLAVAVCGDPYIYARALFEMEQIRAAGPQLAVAANGGLLMNRIERLVGVQKQQANRLTGLVAGLIVLTTVASIGVCAKILLPASKKSDANPSTQALSVNRPESTDRTESRDAVRSHGSAHNVPRALIPGLQNTSGERRNEAVEPSLKALQDQREQGREAEAKSSGGIDNRTAAEILDQEEKEQRQIAFEILIPRRGENSTGTPKASQEEIHAIAQERLNRFREVRDKYRQSAFTEGLRAVNSSNPEERAVGVCKLGRNGRDAAIPTLLTMLGDDASIEPVMCRLYNWSPALETFKQTSPGEVAAIALADIGQPAVGPLVGALSTANPSVRRNAAWAIGEIRGGLETDRSAAVGPLIALLHDQDPWVRTAAAFSLGELRPGAATEPLIAALGDLDWKVREMAARALGEMKARAGVESLLAILLRDNHQRVRNQVAWALGEIQDPRALDGLTIASRDLSKRVRATAKWAISEIRSQSPQPSPSDR